MPKNFSLVLALAAVVLLTGASCLSLNQTSAGPVGMYRSLDKGETWQQIVALPTAKGVQSLAGLNIFRIYDDPSDQNAMYIGTRGQGLYFTYDNGDSWRSVSAMTGKFIYGLAVDPKDKCVIYASDGLHIYKTKDCTRTWDLVYTEERPDQRFVSIAVDYSNSKVIYGAQLNGDVIKSIDAGRSWRVMKRFGFTLQYMTADPSTPKRIYLASYREGLYRSDDGGESWNTYSKVFDEFTDSKIFYRLVLNPSEKDSLFWVSRYGVLKSKDAGVTWEVIKLIPPPGSVNIYGFAVSATSSKEIYYSATILSDQNKPVRSTFYKTVDGGNSWVTKKLPTNSIPTAIRVHPIKTDALFMGFTTLDQQAMTTF